MGVVDLATAADGTPVALKRLSLHGSAADMARARSRIRREADVLRQLDHPGIVRLLDVVDDGDDVVLVMPYLPGGSLADRVAATGPLPPADVDAIAGHLLDALAAAHRQGVVHRDVKPGNVLFAADGRPLLTDFGVARSRDATPGLTATDLVVGTPGFMAPEQARGEEAGPASDVFGLGATLAFAATGRSPFGTGDPRVLMYRAAHGKVERLPRSVPIELRRRIEPLLDPRPGRRPTAAGARGGPAGTWPRTAMRRRGPRRAGRLAIGVALAGLLASGLAVVLLAGDDGDPAEAVAPPTTAAPCEGLPYQPCGGRPAPFTDGRSCTDDHADYDEIRENGCEAAPDVFEPEGTALETVLEANIVPADDVDRYTVAVDDRVQLLCDGTLTLTLTAPAGVAQRLDVLGGDGAVLGSASSADGEPGAVRLKEASCGGDDATTLTARVTSIGTDRSDEPYRLERAGSF